MYRRGIVVGCSLAIGLSFGLTYGGDLSNHSVYLLPGLRLARPGFLGGDWFATEVFIPHGPFEIVVALFDSLNILPWALAIANVLAIAFVAILAYRMVLRYSDDDALIAWLVFAFLFFGIHRAESFGQTYFFSSSLQPSTIATTFAVAAIYAFVRGRFFLSGVLLAIGGAFHVNYLVLFVLAFELLIFSLEPKASSGDSWRSSGLRHW
jgi:hypothetical protein